MVDFNEIPLSSLKGIDFIIGEKCDSDGNGKLTGAEISIFSAERNSNRYIFEKNLNIDWLKRTSFCDKTYSENTSCAKTEL